MKNRFLFVLAICWLSGTCFAVTILTHNHHNRDNWNHVNTASVGVAVPLGFAGFMFTWIGSMMVAAQMSGLSNEPGLPSGKGVAAILIGTSALGGAAPVEPLRPRLCSSRVGRKAEIDITPNQSAENIKSWLNDQHDNLFLDISSLQRDSLLTPQNLPAVNSTMEENNSGLLVTLDPGEVLYQIDLTPEYRLKLNRIPHPQSLYLKPDKAYLAIKENNNMALLYVNIYSQVSVCSY